MKLNLQTGKKVRIEMLPLIDIVFLLLVFFIYAMLSMAVHRGLSINLPSSSAAEIEKKLVLSVTVTADGSVWIDKTRIPLENLAQQLRKQAKGHIDPGVLLFADRSLSYQKLFQVLDRIQQAGFEKISLQAEAESR
ncbi:MAG: biopolymer transporter ExbD [Pseudomonadota bacterium]|nr:MAG: biopolymer transporter ExbD [Desulfobacteraceae bacterium]